MSVTLILGQGLTSACSDRRFAAPLMLSVRQRQRTNLYKHMTLTIDGEESHRAAIEVALTLAALSTAWRERRYDDLAGFLAEDMVFTLPGFGGRLEGATAVVASYREFMERVTLTAYEEQAPTVDVWGETAVASFRWEMTWLAGGVPNQGAGHDLFVFRRAAAGESWRAVWRTMAFEAPAEQPRTPAAQ
jgi:hypothetical protein